MAQVKIYGLKSHLREHRGVISDIIHSALIACLGLPADKKFQRFLALEPEDFLFPADRTSHYTLIEIVMFEGRAPETIKGLLKAIMAGISGRMGLHPNDVEITVFAPPKYCWGIRGKTGDELDLNYKVDV